MTLQYKNNLVLLSQVVDYSFKLYLTLLDQLIAVCDILALTPTVMHHFSTWTQLTLSLKTAVSVIGHI